MTHSFQRYTAAGNTFVVMNTWEDPLSLSREEMQKLVRAACDYKTGVGADGIILINQSSSAPFRMDFYNPDGSTGMLCGNGSRCAVQAAGHFGFATEAKTEFEVLGAVNRAEVLANGDVRVYFQDPTVIRLNFDLPVENNASVKAGYVDLGSQHVVVFFDELQNRLPFLKKTEAEGGIMSGGGVDSLDVAHYGRLLRWHPEFAPVGANANFIEVREDGEEKYLRIRTFERGVEGETLACGTGCMSSAIVARLTGRIPQAPIRLLTQSGEYVTVNFELSGDRVSKLSLEGSVIAGEEGTLIFDETNGKLEVEYL